jgi:hypothetical protein
MSAWVSSKKANGNGASAWLYSPEQLARSLGPDGKAKRVGREWRTLCPAHDDHDPSLDIGKEDGRLLFCCRAGCSQDQVLSALQRRGLWAEGPQPKKLTPKPAAAPHGDTAWKPMVPPPADARKALADILRCDMLHEYYDADDRLLCYVRRTEAKGGKDKVFLPLTYGSLGGKVGWHSKAPGQPRPLYGLNRLSHAAPDAVVLLCEGEKAADAAQRMFPDHVALSWMGGAKADSLADLTPLAGLKVDIWPDADQPGREVSVRFGKRLPGSRILDTTGLPHGFDAADLELLDVDPLAWLGERLREEQEEPDFGETLPFTLFADIKPALDADDFVEGLLTTTSLTVVYGEPGSGKTFWVLDLALHVAAGMLWHGRQVDQGAVIYLALEGGSGIRNRITAARTRLGLQANTPMILVQSPVDLRTSDADVAKVVATIRTHAHRLGMPVRLVVVDTLARAFGGGNENASEDMGALVANSDMIRDQTKACVLYIHHCGKDAARGSRGHSSLKAATDTEIEVTCCEKVSTARVGRQRDLEGGDRFAFQLEQVALGTNKRGKPVTSCVVVAVDAPAAPDAGTPLTDNEKIALRTLDQAMKADGLRATVSDDGTERSVVREADWRNWFYREGMPGAERKAKEKAFKRAVDSLLAKGRIGSRDDFVWTIARQ